MIPAVTDAAVLIIIITGVAALPRAARAWRRAGHVIDDARAELEARRHLAAIIPPPPDLEFLGPPGGCVWCCDLENPGDPRDCTCERPCSGIDWCNAGGWTTNLIPVITEKRPS